eukprot:1161408-Pelagomonas_calceolata.AAC.8
MYFQGKAYRGMDPGPDGPHQTAGRGCELLSSAQLVGARQVHEVMVDLSIVDETMLLAIYVQHDLESVKGHRGMRRLQFALPFQTTLPRGSSFGASVRLLSNYPPPGNFSTSLKLPALGDSSSRDHVTETVFICRMPKAPHPRLQTAQEVRKQLIN